MPGVGAAETAVGPKPGWEVVDPNMFGLAADATKGEVLVVLLLNRLLEPKALVAGAAPAPKAFEVAGAGKEIGYPGKER
jgi:hypothetical protein